MISWKPQDAKYGGGESTFWETYQKEGDRTIVEALRASLGKPVVIKDFEYAVKTVKKSTTGQEFTFLTRKAVGGQPASAAPQTSDIQSKMMEQLIIGNELARKQIDYTVKLHDDINKLFQELLTTNKLLSTIEMHGQTAASYLTEKHGFKAANTT